MKVSREDYRKFINLRNEVSQAAMRVTRHIIWGTDLDPEDIVVLRGSTEALIEMAEESK